MTRRTMAAHDLDPFSLCVGAILALVGLAFLFLQIDVTSFDLERIWPVGLMVVGLLIVLVTVRPWPRRNRRAPADELQPDDHPFESSPLPEPPGETPPQSD